jgi:ABC-type phosphate/phosphonate transport system ATPase subunit
MYVIGMSGKGKSELLKSFSNEFTETLNSVRAVYVMVNMQRAIC